MMTFRPAPRRPSRCNCKAARWPRTAVKPHVLANLSATSSQNVTVNFGFSGAATAGSDYSASSTSLLIPAGQLSGSIT